MTRKDIGLVTAYAYAVDSGYTGTETEFAQLMADLAIKVDEFENFSVTVTTLPAGSSATASYADGVLSLGIPRGDKGEKGNTGETGATPQLSIGTVETTTEPSVTITGTTDNPVLNFGLVKGDKGDTGEVSQAQLDAAVTDLKSDINLLGDALINDTNYIINLNTAFKQGVVHNRAYSNPDTTDTITTYSSLFKKKYMPFSLHVDIANGYKALMVFYSSDDDTSAITGTWLTGNNTITDTASTLSDDYFCVEVRKTDNTAIIPSEATSAVSVYYSMPLLVDRKKVVNIQADSTSALTITETCDICGNGHTINVGQNAEFGLHILGDSGVVVDVYDLTIKGGTESAVRVNHGATVNFYNCSFEDATNHGLSVVNSNTNCFDCIAQNNGVDGFNYHLVGKNTAYNCFALNNGDDGISNHEDSYLKIIGGRFVGNGKAGIAGPTYGAGNTDISNVYCADNVQYGIIVHNDSALTEKVIIQNAILDSSPVGLAVNGYQVITHGVVYANCTTNTTVGNGGTITAL